VKPCLLKAIKLLLGEASEQKREEYPFAAIPFGGAYEIYVERCERPGRP